MKITTAVMAIATLLATTPATAKVYDLVIARQQLEVVPGRADTVVTMNGTVPGPVLRFTDGEDVEVRVTNRLQEIASIHWHGLLVPGHHDGAPGFNGFAGIAPGTTYTYHFKIRQTGTYWYHAHSGTQEQAGQYGAMIIDPVGPDPLAVDREHIVLISEQTAEDPERIIRNLKADSGYYNWNKRTFPELIRDARKFGLGKTLAERKAWGEMRMDATDIADVSGYTLLVNGRPSAAKPWLPYRPGEKVRLRLINGTAMSFVDVRVPGTTMTIVAADGRPVEPVTVDEFRMGVAETYDVIVTPKDGSALPLWVETLDRRASVLASLAPDAAMPVTAPAPRPKQVLLLSEMGHAMGDMGSGNNAGGHVGHAMPAAAAGAPSCSPEHTAMGHCMPKPTVAAPLPAAPSDPSCPPEHAAMGHCNPTSATTARTASDPECPPEHAAMGHCTPKTGPTTADGSRFGTAVAITERPQGGTPYPVVDYGFGKDPMAGMDHAAMGHGGMAMPVLGREGDTDGSGRVFGWATGAPYGARVLSLRDLVSAEPHRDTRPPTREIVIRIQGNMERYIWTLNGAKFGEAPPIRVGFGERVRITFINETMMAHPMHLHGMFFEVENGQPADRLPWKNVVAVAPGRTQSIVLTADEPGEWPLHCHLLYHMDQGMMQKLVVAQVAAPPTTTPDPHAGHGSH